MPVFKKLSIASDHAGFQMKEALKEYLAGQGYELTDVGTNSVESCDYPVFAEKAARLAADGQVDAAVIVCGSGIGVSIAANKVKGIRAVLCSEPLSAKMSRLHNNANCICMGGRMIGVEMAKEILNVWLNTEFEGGRHQKRIDMLDAVIDNNK